MASKTDIGATSYRGLLATWLLLPLSHVQLSGSNLGISQSQVKKKWT